MLRIFAALLLALVSSRASDEIFAPTDGKSAQVKQPHVVAELIPETTAIEAGKPFGVALHLHMDPDWHTYWINPGEAGLPTKIAWTLPPGFTAGPIQWPTPEKHSMGPIITYGYGGDVYLLTTITPPKGDLPQHFEVKAKASWLVCQEECIPGKGEFTLPLDSGMLNLRLPANNSDFFAQARERMPVENDLWQVSGDYTKADEKPGDPNSGRAIFEMGFQNDAGKSPTNFKQAYFFPEQTNVLSGKDPVLVDAMPHPGGFTLDIDLAQNGEMPEKLSGVLVADQPLIGSAKAVHISKVVVMSGKTTAAPAPTGGTVAAAVPSGGADVGTPSPTAAGTAAATTAAEQPLLIAVLGAAFLGGLILNLMPCVLPVLSLKVFSLIKHAEDKKSAWVQGLAFTAGVVISFWLLAGALLALQSAGNHLGWGFQMQSPGFVLALIVLFFLIGLNLFGVFEIGTSLVGLDAKAASQTGGTASSFLNGALATLAATPCTAPFMGSSLGFAAQQPPFAAMLIFTFLALGMATPYLLLTIFPGALRFVPKPGAWMESLKQFMGFLLIGTSLWLVPIFGALMGADWVGWVLFALLFLGMAGWTYGRWGIPRTVLVLAVAALALFALRPMPTKGWQNWTPDAVDAAVASGKPVFVDFTAAWCLSCKVNERVALGTDEVKKAFTDKNVALFRADWTHSDPAITKALTDHNRAGVPMYLLYAPKTKDPQVLPEVLTPGIVLEALKGI